MAGGRGAIWTERATVALILACLGGALLLVVRARMGRVPVDADPSPGRSQQAKAAPAPVAVVPPVKKKPPPEPPPPVEDPTAKAIGLLSSQTARELAAAREADSRAEALEAARAKALAEADGWKRRTMLVKKQVATLNAQAESLERGLTAIDAERDVLEHERDALKAALSKASQRSGYSVLPYKGANGTWRRPIVIECANGGAKLQPKGESFNTLDLSPRIHPRSSPIVRAVARELLHIQSADSPDGAPVVPYLVFLVRPSGVRPYYEARASLEPLGIAYGYELIEERLTVDVPDYDDVSLWDGSVALDLPLVKAPATPQLAGSRDSSSPATAGAGLGSGAGRHRDPAIESGARLANAGNGGSPDEFIWPNHGGGARGGGAKPASDPWAQALEPAPTEGKAVPGGGLATGAAMSGGGVLPDLEPAGQLGGMANAGGGGFPRSGALSGSPPPGGSGSLMAGGAGAPPTGSLAASGETPPSQAGLLGGPSGGAIPPPRPFGGMAGLSGGGDSTPSPESQPPPGASSGNTEDLGTAPLASGPQASAGSQAGSAKPGGNDPNANPQAGGTGAAGGSNAPAGSTGAAPPGSLGIASPVAARAADSAFEPTSAPPLESSTNQGAASAAAQDSLLNSILGSGSSTASQKASATGSSSSPSSSSNSSSASGSSGMPLSSTSSESASAGGAESSSADKADFMPPPPPSSNPTKTAIDMPFEITVVCRRNSILLHPGAYVLSGDRLHDRAPNGEGALANELRAIVKKRSVADPLIHLKPSLKFLVEAQGSSTFWEARRQLLFTLPDWPMSFRVSGSQERLTADAEVR